MPKGARFVPSKRAWQSSCASVIRSAPSFPERDWTLAAAAQPCSPRHIRPSTFSVAKSVRNVATPSRRMAPRIVPRGSISLPSARRTRRARASACAGTSSVRATGPGSSAASGVSAIARRSTSAAQSLATAETRRSASRIRPVSDMAGAFLNAAPGASQNPRPASRSSRLPPSAAATAARSETSASPFSAELTASGSICARAARAASSREKAALARFRAVPICSAVTIPETVVRGSGPRSGFRTLTAPRGGARLRDQAKGHYPPLAPRPARSARGSAPLAPRPARSARGSAPLAPRPARSARGSAPLAPRSARSAPGSAPLAPRPSRSVCRSAPLALRPSRSVCRSAPLAPRSARSACRSAPLAPRPAPSVCRSAPLAPRPAPSARQSARWACGPASLAPRSSP